MINPQDSDLCGASHDEIAKVLYAEAMQGGPDPVDCADPVLWVLWWEARQFMLGACALLAAHLNETRGYPVVVLETRPKGQKWCLRHAAVTPLPLAEAEEWIRTQGGFSLPVLDAVGGGTFEGRMDLYWQQDHEYRVVLANDPNCSVHWLYRPRADRAQADQEHVLSRLPGLSLALGVPFDLKQAVRAIVASGDAGGRRLEDDVLATGIAEWAAGRQEQFSVSGPTL